MKQRSFISSGLVSIALAATLTACGPQPTTELPTPTAVLATATPIAAPATTLPATAVPATATPIVVPATAAPAPTTPPSSQEWQQGPDGDLNGDGVYDWISFRRAPVTLSVPVGFADPSIVAVELVEELLITQEASPGGRGLLVLNPHALSAENVPLSVFGPPDAGETPAGFLVVIYGGERYSYHITTVGADGVPYGPGMQVAWDVDAQGYRIQ